MMPQRLPRPTGRLMPTGLPLQKPAVAPPDADELAEEGGRALEETPDFPPGHPGARPALVRAAPAARLRFRRLSRNAALRPLRRCYRLAHRTRRVRIRLFCSVVTCGLLLAACGGSSTAGGTKSGPYGPRHSPYALSKCMRENGLSHFPDPSQGPNGGGIGFPGGLFVSNTGELTVDGVSFSGPALRKASRACRAYLPPSGPPPARCPSRSAARGTCSGARNACAPTACRTSRTRAHRPGAETRPSRYRFRAPTHQRSTMPSRFEAAGNGIIVSAGSAPRGRLRSPFPIDLLSEFRGAIAQLGERLLCTQEVTGSIPVGSTQEVPGDGVSCLRPLQAAAQHRRLVAQPAARRAPQPAFRACQCAVVSHSATWRRVYGSPFTV